MNCTYCRERSGRGKRKEDSKQERGGTAPAPGPIDGRRFEGVRFVSWNRLNLTRFLDELPSEAAYKTIWPILDAARSPPMTVCHPYRSGGAVSLRVTLVSDRESGRLESWFR